MDMVCLTSIVSLPVTYRKMLQGGEKQTASCLFAYIFFVTDNRIILIINVALVRASNPFHSSVSALSGSFGWLDCL